MGLRLLVTAALSALLLATPAAAFAASPATPEPTASPSATSSINTNPARDATWKKVDAHSAKLSWKAPTGASIPKPTYVVIINVTLGKKKVKTYTNTNVKSTGITYKSIPAGAKLSGEVTTSVRYAQDKHDKVPTYTQPQLKPAQVKSPMLIATGVQLKATWKAPSTSAGTLITGYHIVLYQSATGTEARKAVKTVDVKADKTSATFTKLKPQTEYYAFIQAVNSKGQGKVAQTNNVTTGAAPQVTKTQEVTPEPTVPPTPTSTASSSSVETLAPGVTVPSQVPLPTSATPTTSAAASASENRGLDPDVMRLLILGGVILALGGAGFLIWRLWRRYI